jgi:multidrug efflux pump subunit AcrB
LTIVLAFQIPKGFFPIQDTGMIQGLAEAAQDVSPIEMMRLQRELGAVLLRDPGIAGYTSNTGTTGPAGYAQTANTARFNIALKPREERTLTATEIINRLRPQIAKVEGANAEARSRDSFSTRSTAMNWPSHCHRRALLER